MSIVFFSWQLHIPVYGRAHPLARWLAGSLAGLNPGPEGSSILANGITRCNRISVSPDQQCSSKDFTSQSKHSHNWSQVHPSEEPGDNCLTSGQGSYKMDQGSGQVVCVSLPLILPSFAGDGPVKFYCFVSAIKLQMRLRYNYILYNPIPSKCQ